MKNEEIRVLEDKDLRMQVEKLRRELFDLRVKAASESIENPMRIQDLKRSVARLKTEQRNREMQRSRGS